MLRLESQSEMKLLRQALEETTGTRPEWTQDEKGNFFGWHYLQYPGQIAAAAQALSEIGARLATITAYADNRKDPANHLVMAYHFALGGVMFTVQATLYDPESGRQFSVPSITPWFANAEWPERECREMYNAQITGDGLKQERLFLDERLESGVMTRLIPFSAMVSSAATSDLWEKVMESKAATAQETPAAGPEDEQADEQAGEPPLEAPAPEAPTMETPVAELSDAPGTSEKSAVKKAPKEKTPAGRNKKASVGAAEKAGAQE